MLDVLERERVPAEVRRVGIAAEAEVEAIVVEPVGVLPLAT